MKTIPNQVAEEHSGNKGVTSWCYVFIHHSKVELVSKTLEKEHYPVFVHESIAYNRGNKRVKEDEQPTFSSLVFIQGDGNEIQGVLEGIFLKLHLIRDCTNGKIVTIPDNIMQPFIRMSESNPTRIRSCRTLLIITLSVIL